MEGKMIVYYDITAYEEIKTAEFEILKSRCIEICNKLEGLGIMSFKIRTEPEEQQQPVGETIEQPAN